MRWRPLSVRDNPEKLDAYDVLHDGVPMWLRVGAAHWVDETLTNTPYGIDLADVLHTLEQSLRLQLDWQYGVSSALHSAARAVERDGDRALDVIDCCLMLTARWAEGRKARDALDGMLAVAGSAWTVGADSEGTPCLHRRVSSTVELAAKEEIKQSGNAARHLEIAWHKVYGRTPDSSGAFREAVRAVEAAAKPVITPSDPKATLGKMIIALRDKPSKWTAVLGTVEATADMMDQLWTSQLDRHGTDDETVALTVSEEEAEASVHLALTLVHWFRSGAVRAV